MSPSILRQISNATINRIGRTLKIYALAMQKNLAFIRRCESENYPGLFSPSRANQPRNSDDLTGTHSKADFTDTCLPAPTAAKF